MKMLYIPSLALILGYAFAAPSSLVPREPSNEPINLHHGPDQGATFNCGTHKYSGADIYTSVQRGVALQNVGETRGKNKYPHSFDNDDSKGNKLAFPDYCPADEKRMEFPLVTPPPYDGGKNNVKQGDERVVYYYTPGDRTYDGNPTVEYCGIMTHVGAPAGASNATGGDYPEAHVIDDDTLHHLQDLTELAPLHNASALAIFKACVKLLPNANNIAYFDSSFHTSMPDAVKTYPIDPNVAKMNKLRKYGFHGISYSFFTRSVADFLGKNNDATNLIALHLGSGASACAVKDGKSVDNSMGLTPVAGLPGATRSGDVDPRLVLNGIKEEIVTDIGSLIFHFTHDAGKPAPVSSQKMHISQAEKILNKESGWKALTGTTDFGHISSSSDPQCRLAFDIFTDRIASYIGSYFIRLDGNVDALVFAGGIGEQADVLRSRVVEKCR